MRPIDADALKPRCFRSREFNCDTGSFDLPVVPWHDIEDVDTLDYAPVRHGEWIIVRDRHGYPLGSKCSSCGRRVKNRGENFCPKCGAKMDGGKDNA